MTSTTRARALDNEVNRHGMIAYSTVLGEFIRSSEVTLDAESLLGLVCPACESPVIMDPLGADLFAHASTADSADCAEYVAAISEDFRTHEAGRARRVRLGILLERLDDEVRELLLANRLGEDGQDDVVRFDKSFMLLLHNKGLTALRQIVRPVGRGAWCRRLHATLSAVFADRQAQASGSTNAPLELLARIELEMVQDAVDALFELRHRRLYDRLFTYAVAEILNADGYATYSRHDADEILQVADPQTPGEVFLLIAAGGGRQARLLVAGQSFQLLDVLSARQDLDVDHLTTICGAAFFALNLVARIIADLPLVYILKDSLQEKIRSPPRLPQPCSVEGGAPGTATSLPLGDICPEQVPPELIDSPAVIGAREPPPEPTVVAIEPKNHGTGPAALLAPALGNESAGAAGLLHSEIARLEAELRVVTQQLDDSCDRERQLAFQVETLRKQLAGADSGRTLPPTLLAQTLERLSHYFTPHDALDVIAAIFPDRIEVLPSARRSARAAEGFRHRKRCFDLLWRLATAYWSALAANKGDNEARLIFTLNEFASNEGAAGAGARGRGLRAFAYHGQRIEMPKHLKIGVKESAAETLRIHFAWLADERKLLIGHCGPHINY